MAWSRAISDRAFGFGRLREVNLGGFFADFCRLRRERPIGHSLSWEVGQSGPRVLAFLLTPV